MLDHYDDHKNHAHLTAQQPRRMIANQGAYQGTTTATETLDGFGLLRSGQAGVSVTTPSNWSRGEDIVCLVTYDVQLERIPLASLIAGESVRTVSSTAIGRIEQYKSNW